MSCTTIFFQVLLGSIMFDQNVQYVGLHEMSKL